MVLQAVDPQCLQLDDLVEAYESSLASNSRVDLADFLPPRDHCLYLPVLRELVRVELDYGWRRGQSRPLDEYQGRFPELFQDCECLQGVAFEEYRLRRQLGDSPSPAEYQQRWGVNVDSWPAESPSSDSGLPLEAADSRMASAHVDSGNRNGSGQSMPQGDALPAVGGNFLDFHLLAELGRGAFGRVYLARQKGLAGRPVVLKISTNIALETRTLAQLQHTNIIPIYSVHQAGPHHALCMPYLGSATLADVLKDLSGRQTLPQSGKGLVDTAQACNSTTRHEIASRRQVAGGTATVGFEPESQAAPVAWKHLERLSYVPAILWLASRLADGLAHAHERGILHRDLKPANILLTDDGQPMLLDFNLSEDVKLRSGASAAFIGGTLPYMAPEHLQAFQQKTPSAVDARCDVYALGVIVYELLTGRHPFPKRSGHLTEVLAQMIEDRRGSPPRLRQWNKAISPAAESILRHCLEPDPARRYQSARELQEDLQRQLEHRPLSHASEPSLRERTGKWIHRHRRLTLAGAAVLALLTLAGLSALLAFRNIEHQRYEAGASFQQFRDDIQQARLLLATSRPSDRQRLDEAVAMASKALDVYHVRTQKAWWDLPAVRRLPVQDQQSLREETGEILLLLAAIAAWRGQSGEPANSFEGLESALELNRLAESAYPPDTAPELLWRQRASLTGVADPAKAAGMPSPSTWHEPQSTKDFCLTAQELMNQGHFRQALPLWQKATRRDPRDLWAWAGLAACHDNLGRPFDAAACYGTSIALAPKLPWLYFQRGVAYLQAKNFEEARADFDKFLVDRPSVAEAYINRALAWEGLKKNPQAIDDINKAIQLGSSQTRVYFIRALLRAKEGDREGAKQDRDKGLQLEPTDELSCVVRGLARLGADPKSALADFNKALQFNPRSLDGLQNKASVLSEQLGKDSEAVQVLDKTLEHYPDFVPARAGRGVLLARLGKRKEAHDDAVECLRRDVQPATLYQVAGIYALTSKQRPEDRDEALFLLSSALRKGYGWNLINIDTDLDPIRNHPDFRRLTAKGKTPAGNQ